MYTYKAVIIDVIDGDTVIVDFDLGFGIWLRNQSIRLAKINAPEMKGETLKAATESKEFLKKLVLNKWVTIKTEKDRKEKYGRWLGTVLVEDNKNLIEINSEIIKAGYAVVYK